MKIEDVELAYKLKNKVDELQSVMYSIEEESNALNSIYLSVCVNGTPHHIPKSTAKKLIAVIESDISENKQRIEAL